MPTGYTAFIHDDNHDKVDVRRYMLGCAKAFGALLHQRDDGSKLEDIQLRKEESYYINRVKTSTADYNHFIRLTNEQLLDQYKEYCEDSANQIKESTARSINMIKKYDAYIQAVRAWHIPGPEFTRYKEFMIQQLEESKRFDCGTYTHTIESFDMWVKDTKEGLWNSLQSAQESYDKHVKSVKESNDWIRTLMNNIPGENK